MTIFGGEQMMCPSCPEALLPELEGVYADIPLYRCRGCDSQWMDAESLDRLDDNIFVEVTELPWTPVTDEGKRIDCPRCALLGRYRGGEAVRLTRLRPPGKAEPVLHRCGECEGYLVGPGALEGLRARAAVAG